MEPAMPSEPVGEHEVGAERLQHLAALDRHGLGHGQVMG